jgi:hypothetical protein
MGKREGEQAPLWIPTTDLPVSPGHPFYVRLNAILDAAGFDAFVEAQCQSFSAPAMGRPSFAPGRYFRLLLVGYFEGLDSAPPPPPPRGAGGRRVPWSRRQSVLPRDAVDCFHHWLLGLTDVARRWGVLPVRSSWQGRK